MDHCWFLIYVNDFPSPYNFLNTIIFADDRNLFFVSTVNRELQNIYKWFISNEIFLNAKKRKFLTFQKANRRDDLPLVLPKLFINNLVIKRQSPTKFLGIKPVKERTLESDGE